MLFRRIRDEDEAGDFDGVDEGGDHILDSS